jgi:tellurite methyltransferase
MSDADRDEWNRRYRDGAYADRPHPTALLAEWESALPRGRALDVACGAGRNALFLAARGRSVDAVDVSAAALERARDAARERGLDVRWLEADLEQTPDDALPPGPYDLIILVRYVHRAILRPLWRRLSPGGMLLCEQHLDSAADVIGPRRAEFRMRPNELLRAALGAGPGVEIRYYREGPVIDPDGRAAALAQLVSFKRDNPA